MVDETAFDDLYREYAARVFGYVRRRVDDPDATADVTAEVFTVAWRRLADVPDPALPWLLGVARRQLANHYRARRRRYALAQKVARHASRSTAPAPSVADEHLTHALRQLSPDDRELLLLIGWEELLPAEAAEVLGLAPATVRTRLHRARQRLEAALQRQEEHR